MSPEELRERRATPGHCPWCGEPLKDGTEIVNENSLQSTRELWVHKHCHDESVRLTHGDPAERIPRMTAEEAYDDVADRRADSWKEWEDR